MKIGNKLNSVLNGEWGRHVRGFGKKYTSSVRRMEDKRIIAEDLLDTPEGNPTFFDDDNERYQAGDLDGPWNNSSAKTLGLIKSIRAKSLARKRRKTRQLKKQHEVLAAQRKNDWLSWRMSFPWKHLF